MFFNKKINISGKSIFIGYYAFNEYVKSANLNHKIIK